ncbi:alpha/beta hydrolase [Antrihabitans cavernicola]|uniref:Alpha/beta hydrolase n=1 Tax=Antrihabitans cavernicola TaxID=2495913 RepID=A0A5A7SAJ8_9NOCA|nr:alpha/beta hydrolase [Spelaeibacter cavernicola]
MDGGPIHVREDGPADGKPILLIRGFANSMHAYATVTPLLTDTYRVVRVDLRGHGCTGGQHYLDPQSQGRALSGVLDHLGVDNVAAVGHSFGADAALAVAALSTRVGEVVVINQAPDYSYADFPRASVLLTLPILGEILHRAASPASVRFFGRIGFAPGYRPATGLDSPTREYDDFRAMSSKMQRVVVLDRRKALADNPLDRQIRDLGKPAAVIHGRYDLMYDCDRTVERFRTVGAAVTVVENAGHSPNIEQPEAVAAALREFLG